MSNYVEFGIARRASQSGSYNIGRFSRETSGKNGKIFDVIITQNGEIEYAVNCKKVEELPKTPATNELIKKADLLKEKVVQCLNANDQPTRYRLYYEIQFEAKN